MARGGHLPPVGLVALSHVLSEGERSGSVDLDLCKEREGGSVGLSGAQGGRSAGRRIGLERQRCSCRNLAVVALHLAVVAQRAFLAPAVLLALVDAL